MNLLELKSHAYEVIVRINQLQAELQATQKAIAEYKEPEVPVGKITNIHSAVNSIPAPLEPVKKEPVKDK